MFWEVASAALRMIAWLALLGGVAPRVLFRKSSQDGPALVARMVVLSALTAGILWLFNQLSVGTFFAGLGVYGVGSYVRGRRHVVRTLTRTLWGRFADLFFLPSAVRLDVVADSGESTAALANDGNAKAESWVRRTRRAVSDGAQIARRSLGSAQQHAVSRAGGMRLGMGRTIRRRSSSGWTHAVSIVAALCALALRLRGERVLTAEEVERVRTAAGWSDTSGLWLPDLLATRLLAELTLSPLAVSSVALGCPLIFLSSWSAQHALRRLAPYAPCWVGAFACAAVPWAAVAQGRTIGLHLVLFAALPWLFVGVGLSASRTHRRVWVGLATCLLHPLAGLLGVAALISSYTSERSERVPRDERVLAYLVLGLLTIVGAILAIGGGVAHIQRQFVPSVATGPSWLAYVAGVASLWLILGARSRRSQAVVLWGRAAGIFLMATLFVSGAITGIAYLSLPLWCVEAQTLWAIAIIVADLSKLLLRSPFRILPLLGLPLLALATLERPARTAEEGLPRPVLELSTRLRNKHLDWNFSLVASKRVLPAFAGVAWPVPGRTVQTDFPAATYRYDPEHPQYIIGTKVSYIVFAGDNTEEELAMRQWIADLVRLEAYPLPHRVPSLSKEGLEVYQIVRKPELERKWRRASTTEG